jgi:hypothetical protein
MKKNSATNFNSFGFWVAKCAKQQPNLKVSIEYETVKEIENVVFSGEEMYGGLDMFVLALICH